MNNIWSSKHKVNKLTTYAFETTPSMKINKQNAYRSSDKIILLDLTNHDNQHEKSHKYIYTNNSHMS